MASQEFILRRARRLAQQAVDGPRCSHAANAWLRRAVLWCMKHDFPVEAVYIESLRRAAVLDILYPEV